MSKLEITRGEWVGVDYAGHYSLQVAPFYGARDLLDEDKTNEAEANMKLCCDAGNTAQKCGLLPSELLKQRDELLKHLRLAYEVGRKHTGGVSPASEIIMFEMIKNAFEAVGESAIIKTGEEK